MPSETPATTKHLEVVAAAIADGRGRILCVRRGESSHVYTSRKYEFPGGKIEPGETPEQAIAREIQEELHCRIAVERRLATVTHRYPDLEITITLMLCRMTSEGITLSEHTDPLWLPPSQFHTLDWAAADLALIAAAQW